MNCPVVLHWTVKKSEKQRKKVWLSTGTSERLLSGEERTKVLMEEAEVLGLSGVEVRVHIVSEVGAEEVMVEVKSAPVFVVWGHEAHDRSLP